MAKKEQPGYVMVPARWRTVCDRAEMDIDRLVVAELDARGYLSLPEPEGNDIEYPKEVQDLVKRAAATVASNILWLMGVATPEQFDPGDITLFYAKD